ncbi:MAG TPA: hypothetical protein VK665_13365 [Candidatus Elarobacter sp.]|nr:hypothetical protein [Candidatus Elarobacter sp.]
MMTGENDGRSRRPASNSGTEVDRRTSGAAATGGGLAARDATTARRGLHQRSQRRIDSPSISFLVHDDSGAPADYQYLYQLIAERADREDDRSKEIDAKATALLYCVPLAFLLRVFMSKRGAIAPSPESLVTFFPQYPTATLRRAIVAMERSCRTGERINDKKTRRLEWATILMAGTTVCVLVLQLVTALR